MGCGGWAGKVEGDGGIEVVYEGELAYEHVPSPKHEETPPYLGSLENKMQSVTALLMELGQQRHGD